jgi:hypothetical protein
MVVTQMTHVLENVEVNVLAILDNVVMGVILILHA